MEWGTEGCLVVKSAARKTMSFMIFSVSDRFDLIAHFTFDNTNIKAADINLFRNILLINSKTNQIGCFHFPDLLVCALSLSFFLSFLLVPFVSGTNDGTCGDVRSEFFGQTDFIDRRSSALSRSPDQIPRTFDPL